MAFRAVHAQRRGNETHGSQELVHRDSFEHLHILEELVGHHRLACRSRCAVWLCLPGGSRRAGLAVRRRREHQAHDRHSQRAKNLAPDPWPKVQELLKAA